MESKPRPRAADIKLEQRAERRFLGEGAKTALAGLFALTTQGCDVCFDVEHEIMERQAAEEQARIQAERAAEKPEQKARREFKEKLVELEKAGYTVEISGINVMAETAGPLTGEMLEEMTQIKNDLSYYDEASKEIKLIEQSTDPLLELKRQLADAKDSKELHIPIYQLRISSDNLGITIMVENWLTDTTIITERFEPLNYAHFSKTSHEEWKKNYGAKLAKVLETIQRDKANLAVTYGKLLTENGVSLNAMDIVQTHPGTGMEEMAKLFAEDDMYSVKLNGFKHDRLTSSSPFIAWDFNSSNQGELALTGSPELPGTLTSVELYRHDWDTVPDWWQGHNNNEVFVDKYGNTVTVETTVIENTYHSEGEQAELYKQTISIMVPTKFLDTSGSESEAVGWNVDLTKLGLPELTDFAFSHPERPVATKETSLGFKFNIYYEGEDTQIKNVYTRFFDEVAEGAENLQTDFYGYDTDQQVVTNILIVPTNGEKNGYFAARNSATISLTDAHMDLMANDLYEVQSTARHETAHALFNHLRLAESKPVADLHKRLSPDFFAAIAEANWQTNGFGGHPDDNTTELFASFINSLKVRDLEATMRTKLTAATAAEYADAAKTLREELTKPLKAQNGPYESIQILEKLTEAETLARKIAAGQ